MTANFGRRGPYKKYKPFTEMLELLLVHGADPAGFTAKQQRLARICLKVIDKALEGDMEAVREVGNRLDGYPPRPLLSEGDIPMFINVKWQSRPPELIEASVSEASPEQSEGSFESEIIEGTVSDPDADADRGNGRAGDD